VATAAVVGVGVGDAADGLAQEPARQAAIASPKTRTRRFTQRLNPQAVAGASPKRNLGVKPSTGGINSAYAADQNN
jgi:hypothetical protein